MRSRDASEPPAVDETTLADMARVVADAQAEIARLVQLGELQNDPIRHPIQALSVHLGALYKITEAGSQLLAHRIQTSARPVDWRDQTEDERDRPAQGAAAHPNATALSRRNALVGSGVVMVALLVGAAAGYAVHGDHQLAAGLAAGQTQCQDVNGGTLCHISVWAKPPPGQAAH